MRSPAEVLKFLNDSDNSVNPSFGLRIFARTLRSDRKHIKLARSQEYIRIRDEVLAKIETMTAQEIVDLSYANRVLNGVKVRTMSSPHIKQYLRRIDELVDSQELNVHNIFQIFSDLSELGLSNSKIDQAATYLLSNQDITLSVLDIKYVLEAVNPYLHNTYSKLVKLGINRFGEIDLNNCENNYLIDILLVLAKLSEESPSVIRHIIKVVDVLVERIRVLSDAELIRSIKGYTSYPRSLQRLFNEVCEYIESQLRVNADWFSERNLLELSDLLTSAKTQDLYVPDTIIQVLTEALGSITRSSTTNYYNLSRILRFFSVFRYKIDPERINQAIKAIAAYPYSEPEFGMFIGVCALVDIPGHNPDEIFSTDEFKQKAKRLSIYLRASGLAAASLKTFDQKWTQMFSEIENDLVEELKTFPLEFGSKLIENLTNFPDVLYSSKLDKLKSKIFESVSELAKTSPSVSIHNAALVLELAPWNQTNVQQLISSSPSIAEVASRAINKVSDQFPFASYVELLKNNPSIITVQSLLAAERLIYKSSYESKVTLANILENCNFEFLSSLSGPNKVARLLKTLSNSNYFRVFVPFFQKISREFLNIDPEKLGYEYNIKLANELKEMGALKIDVAEHIVKTILSKERISYPDIVLNLASTDFSRFDEETIRIRLLHPTMNSQNQDEFIAILPSLLRWPHYEGYLEDEYTAKFINFLENSTRKDAGRLIIALKKVTYSSESIHRELYRKYSRALVDALAKNANTFNPEMLTKLALAYEYSVVRNKKIADLISGEFLRFNKLEPRNEILIHNAMSRKGAKVPSISEAIAGRIVRNYPQYNLTASGFIFELAEAGYAREPWGLEVVKKVNQNFNENLYEKLCGSALFGMIQAGLSEQEIQPWVELLSRLDSDSKSQFVTLLVKNYLKQRGATFRSSLSFEHINLIGGKFGISPKLTKSLVEALENKSVAVSTTHVVEGYPVPLWLPAKNTAIWPLNSASFFDDKDIRMSHLMYLDQLETKGVQVVKLNGAEVSRKEADEVFETLKGFGVDI